MNISIISIIVTLALLLLKTKIPPKRIDDFMRLYRESLSDLAKSKFEKIEGKIVDKDTNTIIEYYDKGMVEIKKIFNEFKKGYDILKLVKRVELLRLSLPILLMIEVLHATLQEFGWFWYEYIWPGLNGIYIVLIISFMLLYFILTVIICTMLSEEKVVELESQILSVIGRYKSDLL